MREEHFRGVYETSAAARDILCTGLGMALQLPRGYFVRDGKSHIDDMHISRVRAVHHLYIHIVRQLPRQDVGQTDVGYAPKTESTRSVTGPAWTRPSAWCAPR